MISDIIKGTENADVLIGSDAAEVIQGLKGNDFLFGEGASDNLIGDGGHDWIYAGDGKDNASGGSGNDVMFGEDGDDKLNGGSGNDTVYGGADDDSLVGGGGADLLKGGTGVDKVSAGGGDDFVAHDIVDNEENPVGELYKGGKGFDTLVLVADKATLEALAGQNIESIFDNQQKFDFEGSMFADLHFEARGFENLVLNVKPEAKDDVFVILEGANLMGNLLVDNGNGADMDSGLLPETGDPLDTSDDLKVVNVTDLMVPDDLGFTRVDFSDEIDTGVIAKFKIFAVDEMGDPVDADMNFSVLTINMDGGVNLAHTGEDLLAQGDVVKFNYMVDDGLGGMDTAMVEITATEFIPLEGFKLIGEAEADFSGVSVSSAGDINNDGKDDLIVGALFNSAGGSFAGASYIVYGGQNFADLVDVNGAINLGQVGDTVLGFKLIGEAEFDFSGVSVSSAGDINNDEIDDLIVGADFNNSAAARRVNT